MSCTPFTWVAMATGTHWNATSVATEARTVMSFHHTLFEGSTHSTRPFHSKGDPYEVKNCTWRNTALTIPPSLPSWHTFSFLILLSILILWTQYCLLYLIRVRKKQKREGMGILFPDNLACLFCGNLKQFISTTHRYKAYRALQNHLIHISSPEIF